MVARASFQPAHRARVKNRQAGGGPRHKPSGPEVPRTNSTIASLVRPSCSSERREIGVARPKRRI